MNEIPEGHLDVIFHHGAYPLWVYLQQVLGINITDVCSRVTKSEPLLSLPHGTLAARLVSSSDTTTLPAIYNRDVTFLINSISTVFEMLKPGVERDGEKVLEAFKFEKNAFNHIYLVSKDDGRPVSDIVIAVVKLAEKE